MCHGITWFHVLCGHADPSLSTLILCHDSLLTGDSCLPCIDLAWFPLKGLCRICREQGKRDRQRQRQRRRRQIARAAYAAFNEQYDWEWDSPVEEHVQSDEHSAGRRYEDWFEGQDMIEDQTEADGLNILDAPSKEKMIVDWLNDSDFPAWEVPFPSSNIEYPSPKPTDHPTVKMRRSCIPVPARKNTGLMHQPKTQRSHIPVPVDRIQKKQYAKSQDELEGIDEMELFDRITF